MTNLLMILLNVAMVGTVIAVVGTLVVRLLRRLLLDGLPEAYQNGRPDEA